MPIYDLTADDAASPPPVADLNSRIAALRPLVEQVADMPPAVRGADGMVLGASRPVMTDIERMLQGLEADARAIAALPLGQEQAGKAASTQATSREKRLKANLERGKAEMESLGKTLLIPIPLLLGVIAALLSRKKELAYEAIALPLDVAQVLVMAAVALALGHCGRLCFSLGRTFTASKDSHEFRDLLEGNSSGVNPFFRYALEPATEKRWLVAVAQLVPLLSVAGIVAVAAVVPLRLAWDGFDPKILLTKVFLWLAVGGAVCAAVAVVGMLDALLRLGRSWEWFAAFVIALFAAGWMACWAGGVVAERRAEADKAAQAAEAAQTVFHCTLTPAEGFSCKPKPPPAR